MDKEILYKNVMAALLRSGKSKKCFLSDAGASKNLLKSLERGASVELWQIVDLAASLGLSTSDLVGDAQMPADLAPLAGAWEELNEEGRGELIKHADLLVRTGLYKKYDQSDLDQREA